MEGTTMKVRFLKPLRVYRKGDIVDLGGGEANVLIARQIVEPYAEPPLLETASVASEVRTAAVEPKRRRRVR